MLNKDPKDRGWTIGSYPSLSPNFTEYTVAPEYRDNEKFKEELRNYGLAIGPGGQLIAYSPSLSSVATLSREAGAALYYELTGRTDFRRGPERLVNRPDALAQRIAANIDDAGEPFYIINGAPYDKYGILTTINLSDTVEVTAQEPLPLDSPPSAPHTVEPYRPPTLPAKDSLGVSVSLAGSVVNQAVRNIFLPRDPLGNPLPGSLNLYTGKTAFDLAEKAPGHMIQQTKYAVSANRNEVEVRKFLKIPAGNLPSNDLPKGIYDNIWGRDASAPAARDAFLSSSVATHNDLPTLRTDSIQALYELPRWRSGAVMGALGVASGAALIYGGTHQQNQTLKTLSISGGSLEIAGGGALAAGSFLNSPTIMRVGGILGSPAARAAAPRLMNAGRFFGTTGSLATAPLTANSFYEDVATGQWFDAVVDATSFASAGATFGGTLFGSVGGTGALTLSTVSLTEAGLVLGSFGIGVLVGTGIDKGAEWATKSALGVDLSPSAQIAFRLSTLDNLISYLWRDPSQPVYTQSIAWKLLQWLE
ncbi:hypothetical protein AAE02nite_05830 [Adhaeribacter aerolatus]|uniref:Uncharacterized protein n=2 Tax=Adhaeribacter aerolatus TaxID=670289 RepID=A0A512AT80_9BACT|nr:hypothetical protein AAE02nite_05830 [Adhaeribacter aerolatus]